ncbi:MAG: endonuclease/exonuclease/phosphatase family protein [Balneolaceae bacterium]
MYQGWWILPYTRLFSTEVKKITKYNHNDAIRLLIANVLESNRKYQLLLNLIEEEQPDFLATLESNSWWQEKMEVLEKDFPYTIKCPKENRYGMHVYSRFPLTDTKIRYLVEDDVPSMQAELTLPSGKKIQMYVVHPAPPSPTENEESAERDAELILIAKKASKKDKPVIVTGDLNDVAWSYTTRLFRKMSDLLDPRVGRGMFNTFHAEYKFIRWPLDHLFHSKHFLLAKMKRLPAFGSDHFPILVELAYHEEKKEENGEGPEPSSTDEEIAENKLQQKADESPDIDR